MLVRRFSAIAFLAAMVVLLPAGASGQAALEADVAMQGAVALSGGPAVTGAGADAGTAASAATVAPMVDHGIAGVRASDARSESAPEPAPQASRNLGQARALMIVGAATFLAGALIGGDGGTVIMVGGAAIGLWGLYQYLR
jgi:hypothetical protein